MIHSRDENLIKLFVLKKPVEKVLVNTPAIFGAMGITINFFPSLLSADSKTCVGTRSTIVSPLDLVFVRKIGYGVRSAEKNISECQNATMPKHSHEQESDDIEAVVTKVLKQMNVMQNQNYNK